MSLKHQRLILQIYTLIKRVVVNGVTILKGGGHFILARGSDGMYSSGRPREKGRITIQVLNLSMQDVIKF